MKKDITKTQLSKFHMHELWKLCAELGIKRGKYDKKPTIVNKIYRELNGEELNGEELNGEELAGEEVNGEELNGEELAGEGFITLSGYDFLNVLLKYNKVVLSKLYKKPCSLERRKQNGNYNMFFITKDRKTAEKVLTDISDLSKYRKTTTKTVTSGGWLFGSKTTKKSITYKIPFEKLSDKEVKRIIDFIKDND